MSAVLLAVFNDHQSAERVRTDLIRDGFPTDRVELTAGCEPGRAALEPGESLHDRFVQYFRTLLNREDERRCAELLADRVAQGTATVTVHPRGAIETARAAELLDKSGPNEILRHDLDGQTWEHAAATHEKPWILNLWVENPHKADCIYCRLFEHADREGP